MQHLEAWRLSVLCTLQMRWHHRKRRPAKSAKCSLEPSSTIKFPPQQPGWALLLLHTWLSRNEREPFSILWSILLSCLSSSSISYNRGTYELFRIQRCITCTSVRRCQVKQRRRGRFGTRSHQIRVMFRFTHNIDNTKGTVRQVALPRYFSLS